MNDYDRLEREHQATKAIVDHGAAWAKLEPVGVVNGSTRDRIAAFCETKRISLDALAAFGARVKHANGGGVELGWGYPVHVKGRDVVTAVKYRPLDPSKPRYAEQPSTFVEPLVAGRRESLDWFVAEGETDAARLYGLVGDVAAVLCLPAGARTFKRHWADAIPRGATVYLALDNDEDGDAGAAKAAELLGRTVRVRPPDGAKDWCEYDGDREQFVELVAAARSSTPRYQFAPLNSFLEHTFPTAEPLLGEPGRVFLAVGSLLLLYGAEGTGKSTLTVDAVAHLAAGQDWLGVTVPRPVRFCVIENEGPPALFQAKLAEKAATWHGPEWAGNVYVFQQPWGEFSFADPDARGQLVEFCEARTIDVVVANPTLGLGVAGSGKPDETQRFVDWLVECGLKSSRAFWLLHHENKAGQISGDWGRHPDTKAQVQADGNQPRTKLVWEKTRWATLPTDTQPKALMLEWVADTKGYTIVELDTAGATDDELEQRIRNYLDEHPLATTNDVTGNVKGTNKRISELLKNGQFDCVDGPRGAKQWFNPNDRGDAADAVPTQ